MGQAFTFFLFFFKHLLLPSLIKNLLEICGGKMTLGDGND
jgi:hypothetical protein